IGAAITAALALGGRLRQAGDLPQDLERLAGALSAAPQALASELALAIDDDPPLMARDGGFTRKGYDGDLDAERALGSETRAVVAALQARLIAETDVKSLKIK